jgi:hypothetical protein
MAPNPARLSADQLFWERKTDRMLSACDMMLLTNVAGLTDEQRQQVMVTIYRACLSTL